MEDKDKEIEIKRVKDKSLNASLIIIVTDTLMTFGLVFVLYFDYLKLFKAEDLLYKNILMGFIVLIYSVCLPLIINNIKKGERRRIQRIEES